jgi:hypothetical protein
VIRKSAVAASLLLVLAAGCGGNSAIPVNNPSSPLGIIDDSIRECAPDPSGTTMTDGVTILENHSKGTVVIEQVSFYGDQHIQLVDAVVVPIRYDAVGISDGWPPPRSFIDQPGLQWDKRVPAVGARIPPAPAVRNLVIAMRPTTRRAIAAGVQVLYRDGNGSQYELRTHNELLVLAAESC